MTNAVRYPGVKCLPFLLAVLALAVSGCGAAAKHAPAHERSVAEIKAYYEAHVHQVGEKLQACEAQRKDSLTWARAMQRVIQTYGEAAMYGALTQADEASYRAEEAGKRVVGLMPATAEAVTRYDSTIQRLRHAASEGLAPLTGAMPEGTAAWKAVVAACEASFR
jgi:hypothetical protein